MQKFKIHIPTSFLPHFHQHITNNIIFPFFFFFIFCHHFNLTSTFFPFPQQQPKPQIPPFLTPQNAQHQTNGQQQQIPQNAQNFQNPFSSNCGTFGAQPCPQGTFCTLQGFSGAVCLPTGYGHPCGQIQCSPNQICVKLPGGENQCQWQELALGAFPQRGGIGGLGTSTTNPAVCGGIQCLAGQQCAQCRNFYGPVQLCVSQPCPYGFFCALNNYGSPFCSSNESGAAASPLSTLLSGGAGGGGGSAPISPGQIGSGIGFGIFGNKELGRGGEATESAQANASKQQLQQQQPPNFLPPSQQQQPNNNNKNNPESIIQRV